MTLLRYNVDKPGSSHAQFRFFARKKEEKNFQQIVYVKYKLEFLYRLGVMNSVYDKLITSQPTCNILLESNFICFFFNLTFLIESRRVGTLETIGTSF